MATHPAYTYIKIVTVVKLLLDLFPNISVWQFEVLSYISIVMHQVQEIIWNVTYLNMPSGTNENKRSQTLDL